MTALGNPNGDYVEFAFSHDKAYDVLEASFFTLVQMHDPMHLGMRGGIRKERGGLLRETIRIVQEIL